MNEHHATGHARARPAPPRNAVSQPSFGACLNTPTTEPGFRAAASLRLPHRTSPPQLCRAPGLLNMLPDMLTLHDLQKPPPAVGHA
eukprot:31778-Prymnesium_polylepis.1